MRRCPARATAAWPLPLAAGGLGGAATRPLRLREAAWPPAASLSNGAAKARASRGRHNGCSSSSEPTVTSSLSLRPGRPWVTAATAVAGWAAPTPEAAAPAAGAAALVPCGCSTCGSLAADPGLAAFLRRFQGPASLEGCNFSACQPGAPDGDDNGATPPTVGLTGSSRVTPKARASNPGASVSRARRTPNAASSSRCRKARSPCNSRSAESGSGGGESSAGGSRAAEPAADAGASDGSVGGGSLGCTSFTGGGACCAGGAADGNAAFLSGWPGLQLLPAAAAAPAPRTVAAPSSACNALIAPFSAGCKAVGQPVAKALPSTVAAVDGATLSTAASSRSGGGSSAATPEFCAVASDDAARCSTAASLPAAPLKRGGTSS
mmetsp:Transcript_3693/g.10145  ORF Transcript_3693/g.10145 Transcript_3693/m.10145 type:complete len:379 (+) Transcript_3693:296-1432(+)